MTDNNKIKVGITQGDINGIGYEVLLKALEDNRILELCTPVIYGSPKAASFYRKLLGLPHIQFNQVASGRDAEPDMFNLVNVMSDEVRIDPGISNSASGEAAFAALEKAVGDLKNEEIDVLVTAPIDKASIQSDKFHFPGHTEYLESAVSDNGDNALMILFNDRIRVALVTTHLPVSRIAETITRQTVFDKIREFDRSLRRDFGIVRPRIAVLALNPHSGDGGLLGDEERDVIIPAIADAQDKKISCFGPYAADGFFGSGNFSKFDGVLAMYHDQGLAPFKTLSMDGGVNFTAGLPVVRTSPDHGTGHDIAGKGLASADSMREAIYAAIDIYRNRLEFERMYRNPLGRQHYDKSKNDNVVLDLTKSDD